MGMHFLELALDTARFFLRLIKLIELDGAISSVPVHGTMCFIYLLADSAANSYAA